MTTILLVLLAILLHEAAHALAAVLCGVPVWGVVIGSGPIVRQGAHWRLRRYPLAVCCAVERRHIHTPLQGILIALGPTLLSFALLPVPTFGPLFLLLNVVNLLPLPGSDGVRLWQALHAHGTGVAVGQ